MWLSREDPDFSSDCSKEQGNEKIHFRSNSPPLEGGESLCEFFVEHPEQAEWRKPNQNSLVPENLRDGSSNLHSLSQRNDVFHSPGKEKFPSKKFLSLLNQDLVCSDSFTQTFLQSILSNVDSPDPVVANAWMETLLDIVDFLPRNIIKGEILTVAVNKGQMSQPVSSRLLCCKMLGKICMKFDSYVIMKEILPVVLSLCQDVDFEVRGCMCRQLAIIAQGIGLEMTKSTILPELVELANDEETFVRIAGIETVVQMLPVLDDDTCKETIIPLVKKFCDHSLNSKDSTLPVVARQLGQLCHGLKSSFSSEQKQWFLGFFQELCKLGLDQQAKRGSFQLNPMPDLLPEVDHKDRYNECRNSCAYNFPAMVLFAGPDNFASELYTSFKNLCNDPFSKVRQTMACGFYEITRLLNSRAHTLHPELVLLLQDESADVLKRLIPFLPESLKAVCCKLELDANLKGESETLLVKALICCEEVSSVTSRWRLHADFLSCLSCLPHCISPETIFNTFVPLLLLKLHTARPLPCRTAAAYSLLVILRSISGHERRKGIINELIRELCYGKSCHKRMLFIRVCELVIELFSKVFFKLHFFKPLLSLSADPVPNIRLRLCTILPRLKNLMKLPKDSYLLQELESCIKSLMSEEKDRDVSAAVSKAIHELDKIEVATESISRRSSIAEFNLDLKDWQKENEERQLCEMDFNYKCIEKNAVSKASQVLGNLINKAGKIPIRKSGTLPKSTHKVVQHPMIDNLFSSHPKTLENIKKEWRISSPVCNIDVQRSISKSIQSSKNFSLPSTPSIKGFKCSIQTTRSQNMSTNTWPRQKRVSNIPKQTVDRCPSPMPPRQLPDLNYRPPSPSKQPQKNPTSSKKVPTEGPAIMSNKETKQKTLKPLSGNILTEVKRRAKNISSSSPEILRKSATFSNLSAESKIPTSSPKRRSTIKD